MKIRAIAEVYANLIIGGYKTEAQVLPADLNEIRCVICAKKIISGDISYKAACGVAPDASSRAYIDHPYLNFCKTDVSLKDTVTAYLVSHGHEYLTK